MVASGSPVERFPSPLGPGETYTADVELADGLHTMQVEYFELIIGARIHLWVEKAPP